MPRKVPLPKKGTPPGRQKGTMNKVSTILREKLSLEHDFHLVDKIVKLYSQTEKLYDPLFEKVVDIMSRNISLEAVQDPDTHLWSEGLLPAEVELFNNTRKDLWAMLSKLLGYCYPHLKTVQVEAGDQDKITFNINVPQSGDRALQFSVDKSKKDTKVVH